MKKKAICLTILILSAASVGYGQRGTTFTGTALIYGTGLSTRTVTRPFTLIINGRTSADDVRRYLSSLEQGGQDALLRDIDDNDLGRFSLGGSIGVPLNAVIVDRDEDSTRIRAVFRRWIGFGELRHGLRSTNYPFGYVELHVHRNGQAEGTFIPAARIRFRNARNGGADMVEIEDFGTFPGRLMGVRMRGPVLRP